MSTIISGDTTAFRRAQRAQNDGQKKYRRQQGLSRSHRRPIEAVYPPYLPADMPSYGHEHR